MTMMNFHLGNYWRRMRALKKTRVIVAWIVLVAPCAGQEQILNVSVKWRHRSPSGACEIAAFSADTGRLFVTVEGGVDVVSARNGSQLAELPIPAGYHATSVACSRRILAVAWAADDKRERGRISFYDAKQLTEIASYSAGYLPDMIVFTPDGNTLLAANEGEPTDDYSFDPEGSISLITNNGDWKTATVREATFTKFNSQRKELIAAGMHISGPNKSDPQGLASVAQDVEPEYIAVRSDSRVAWITLQENNAIAELDVDLAEITAIHPLGLKNFRSLANRGEAKLVSLSTTTGLDVSDQDDGVKIRHWPIWGMYQPDGIATFQQDGVDYLVTANEGDPRDYADFHEAVRVSDLAAAGVELSSRNPARRLTDDSQLGRLEVSRFAGNIDGNGGLEQLVCLGTRSFSIWGHTSESLELVFDSGSDFERIISQVAPARFNADSKSDSPPDVRSPSRGPEPESVVVFNLGRRRLAAIGLERTGGAMLYNISRPREPVFLTYLHSHEANGICDLAPEGLLAISGHESPSGKPYLVLCNEGSGTMTAWEVNVD
jgi:hypothetical protein